MRATSTSRCMCQRGRLMMVPRSKAAMITVNSKWAFWLPHGGSTRRVPKRERQLRGGFGIDDPILHCMFGGGSQAGTLAIGGIGELIVAPRRYFERPPRLSSPCGPPRTIAGAKSLLREIAQDALDGPGRMRWIVERGRIGQTPLSDRRCANFIGVVSCFGGVWRSSDGGGAVRAHPRSVQKALVEAQPLVALASAVRERGGTMGADPEQFGADKHPAFSSALMCCEAARRNRERPASWADVRTRPRRVREASSGGRVAEDVERPNQLGRNYSTMWLKVRTRF